MEELAEQIKGIKDLGKLGKDIPGLNKDSVIENIIKKDKNLGEYIKMIDAEKEENVERGMSKEEAEKKAKEDAKAVLDGVKKSLEPMVEEEIIKMKQEYKIAKEALDSIPAEVTATVANAALPAALPPAVPNPAYTLGVAIQTKKSILKTLNVVLSSLTTVLMIATKLKFKVPAPVIALIAAITTVTNLLSAIPG